jgi:hypothetical protein
MSEICIYCYRSIHWNNNVCGDCELVQDIVNHGPTKEVSEQIELILKNSVLIRKGYLIQIENDVEGIVGAIPLSNNFSFDDFDSLGRLKSTSQLYPLLKSKNNTYQYSARIIKDIRYRAFKSS